MNQFIEIYITVLRHDISFKVICEPKQDIKSFKKHCVRFCPIPIKDFTIILRGKILNEEDSDAWDKILRCENIYLFVNTFQQKIVLTEYQKNLRLAKKLEKFHEKPKLKLPLKLLKDSGKLLKNPMMICLLQLLAENDDSFDI